jgi:hypothetical protein
VVQPHALVLFAAEMAVAPLEPVPQEYVEVDLDDEDAAPIPKPEGGSALFSEPEKPVAVVLDRWLRFQTTAVEAAQLYCLRERLAATFAYKVKRRLLAISAKPMLRLCFTALPSECLQHYSTLSRLRTLLPFVDPSLCCTSCCSSILVQLCRLCPVSQRLKLKPATILNTKPVDSSSLPSPCLTWFFAD